MFTIVAYKNRMEVHILKQKIFSPRLVVTFLISIIQLNVAQTVVVGVPLKYSVITDREVRIKPPLPALGPAGSVVTDPVFGTRILRVTDGNTNPDHVGSSYNTPDSTQNVAWNADDTIFIVSNAGAPIPFRFNANSFTASRMGDVSDGEGGLVIRSFSRDPWFSATDPNLVYGGNDNRTIVQYDFRTNSSVVLLNLNNLGLNLGSDTIVAGVAASFSNPEKIAAFFGANRQDDHRYIVVFEKNNPSNRKVLDTVAKTIGINGMPINPINTPELGFEIHSMTLDKSGRYVTITRAYKVRYDSNGQLIPQPGHETTIWDTQTDAIYPITVYPTGHDASGYGTRINNTETDENSQSQWLVRSFLNVDSYYKTIVPPITQSNFLLGEHPNWNNVQPDVYVPFLSASYRYGVGYKDLQSRPWLPWHEEVIAVRTDGNGAQSTVWRFAHHRSDIFPDNNPTDLNRVVFAYSARAQISRSGKYAIFNSNWEKTLGCLRIYRGGCVPSDLEQQNRADVFLVELPTEDDLIAPVLSNISAAPTTSSSTITWATNEASDSKVEFGVAMNNLTRSTPVDYILRTAHSISIRGLASNTRYYYRVRSRDRAGNVSVSSSTDSFVTRKGRTFP